MNKIILIIFIQISALFAIDCEENLYQLLMKTKSHRSPQEWEEVVVPKRKYTQNERKYLEELESFGGLGRVISLRSHYNESSSRKFSKTVKKHDSLNRVIELLEQPNVELYGPGFHEIYSILKKHNVPVYLNDDLPSGIGGFVKVTNRYSDNVSLRFFVNINGFRLKYANWHELQHARDYIFDQSSFFESFPPIGEKATEIVMKYIHKKKLTNEEEVLLLAVENSIYHWLEVRAYLFEIEFIKKNDNVYSVFNLKNYASSSAELTNSQLQYSVQLMQFKKWRSMYNDKVDSEVLKVDVTLDENNFPKFTTNITPRDGKDNSMWNSFVLMTKDNRK